jgi:hypothetical protein
VFQKNLYHSASSNHHRQRSVRKNTDLYHDPDKGALATFTPHDHMATNHGLQDKAFQNKDPKTEHHSNTSPPTEATQCRTYWKTEPRFHTNFHSDVSKYDPFDLKSSAKSVPALQRAHRPPILIMSLRSQWWGGSIRGGKKVWRVSFLLRHQNCFPEIGFEQIGVNR